MNYKLIVFCILIFVEMGTGMQYIGNNQLRIRNVTGDEQTLQPGGNMTINNSQSYYFTLESKSQTKDFKGAVHYITIIFSGLLMGVILIVGLYMILKTIMY